MTGWLSLENLGQLIHKERKAKGIILETLEMFTGLTKKTLIKIEKGGVAKFSTIEKILRCLDLRMQLVDKNTKNQDGKRVKIETEWY